VTCVPALTCRKALQEATLLWPDRKRASDGICPSAQHSATNPNSDHERGNAYDLTHDPANGVDCALLVAHLVRTQDFRVAYVIYARTIWRSYIRPAGTRGPDGIRNADLQPWQPERYTGSNPHNSHMHVSILPDYRNEIGSWWNALAMEDDMVWSDKDSENLAAVRSLLEQINHHISGKADDGSRLALLVRDVDRIADKTVSTD
jgi:hypothetical protein